MASIVAIEVLLLLQIPPVVSSVSVVVLPRQALAEPLIGATTGDGLTVKDSVLVMVQPRPSVTP